MTVLQMKYRIKGGLLVIPGAGGTVQATKGDILIGNDRIEAVGDIGFQHHHAEDIAVIDAQGCAVIPGLINAHCHAGMSLLRSYADDMRLQPWLEEAIWPVEAVMTPDDIYWGTLLSGLEMLKGGVTTFADMYFAMEDVANATVEIGMKAVLSLGLIGIGPNAAEDLLATKAFFDTWHQGADDRIHVQLGPHAPYTCPPEYLREVVTLAKELGAGIHVHIAETEDEVDGVGQTYGRTPVEYLDDLGVFDTPPVLGAHCVYVTNQDQAILADRQVGVAHCPQSNQKLGAGIAPIPAMRALDIPVGLGTDGAASTGRLDLWAEMRAASYVQKVIDRDPEQLKAKEMLYMATRGGALALGLDDTGALVPGFRADLAIVDLSAAHLTPCHDPIALLAYAAGPSDVRDVMVDGEWVVRDCHLTTLDENKILRRCREQSKTLMQRVRGE